jgi:hypothetical protein
VQNPAFDEMAELFLLVLLISHTSRGWRTRAARQPLVYLFLVDNVTFVIASAAKQSLPYLGIASSHPSTPLRSAQDTPRNDS